MILRTRAACLTALMTAVSMLFTFFYAAPALAQAAPSSTPHHGGGEANLVVPNLADPTIANFMNGTPGATLLYAGIVVSAFGMLFGFVIYGQLKNLPVHKSMLEISELIYATCKTYLQTQLK